jgi:hypothetical protein
MEGVGMLEASLWIGSCTNESIFQSVTVSKAITFRDMEMEISVFD